MNTINKLILRSLLEMFALKNVSSKLANDLNNVMTASMSELNDIEFKDIANDMNCTKNLELQFSKMLWTISHIARTNNICMCPSLKLKKELIREIFQKEIKGTAHRCLKRAVNELRNNDASAAFEIVREFFEKEIIKGTRHRCLKRAVNDLMTRNNDALKLLFRLCDQYGQAYQVGPCPALLAPCPEVVFILMNHPTNGHGYCWILLDTADYTECHYPEW